MKSLIVYYSLEGNTKYVAEKIASELQGDLLQLIPKKAYPTGKATKFIFGGRSAIMGDTPVLESYDVDIASYDQIIIGTPVWASTFAPPVHTFLQQEKLAGKKLALFACSAGGNATKCFEKLKEELQITDTSTDKIPVLSLIDPEKRQTEENLEQIRNFCAALL